MAEANTFRNANRDFAERDTKCAFGNLNKVQQSRAMTRFYVKEVLGRLMPGSVPEVDDDETINDSLVDGSGDVKCDFMFRQDEKVLIIQTKYAGPGVTESDSEFDSFCDILRRLHPQTGREFNKSRRVVEAASDIDWETDHFELHFITLAKGTKNIVAREEQGQAAIKGIAGIEERVDIFFFDEGALNEKYREAITTGGEIQDGVPLIFSRSGDEPPWLTHRTNEGRVAYIGRIAAAQLKNLYGRYKSSLFGLNIRDFIGETSTNKKIIETARATPEDFFFFNNGISAVATAIRPDQKTRTLTCERLSIINGAQTVRSLHKAFKSKDDNPGRAEVLIRVTEVSLRRTPKERGFLDGVTRYNNTQNAIKLSDFRSNDAVQLQLADRWDGESRSGRKFWYKNKRSGEPKKDRTPISMEDFTKTIFAFRYGPADLHGGSSYLFDAGPQGGYGKVFGETSGEGKAQVWDALTDERFRLLAGTWHVCESAHFALEGEKARRGEAAAKGPLERRWLVYFTVGELLRGAYRRQGDMTQLEHDLRQLGTGSDWVVAGGGDAKRVAAYTDAACDVLVEDYEEEQSKEGWSHRNWTRSEKTLDRIKRKAASRAGLLISAHGLLRRGKS